jgi:hypothetical protein
VAWVRRGSGAVATIRAVSSGGTVAGGSGAITWVGADGDAALADAGVSPRRKPSRSARISSALW